MSEMGSSIARTFAFDAAQKRGLAPEDAQESDYPFTSSGNTAIFAFGPMQRMLGVASNKIEPQAQPTPKKTARSTNRIAAKPRSPRMLLSNRSNAAQGLE